MDLTELTRQCREKATTIKEEDEEFDSVEHDDLEEALGLLEDCVNVLGLMTDPENTKVRLPGYMKKDLAELEKEITEFLSMWNV